MIATRLEWANLARMIWQTARQPLDFTAQAVVMGILNVTPDSFSDAGNYLDVSRALAHGLEMLAQGAAVIDVGGESTRPGAEAISLEEEMRRVIPVVERLVATAPGCVISVDTAKAAVAEAALARGAAIINDVTALRGDPEMAGVVARTGAGVVLMHMQGVPATMQQNPIYQNVTAEVRAFFEQRFEAAMSAGIATAQIAFDPGIGFGKTVAHNLALLRGLPALQVENRPLVVGVSRKGFLREVTGVETISERLWPTLALTALLRERGANVLRVHDVRSNLAALRMAEAVLPMA